MTNSIELQGFEQRLVDKMRGGRYKGVNSKPPTPGLYRGFYRGFTGALQLIAGGETIAGTAATSRITDEYAMLHQLVYIPECGIGRTLCYSGVF